MIRELAFILLLGAFIAAAPCRADDDDDNLYVTHSTPVTSSPSPIDSLQQDQRIGPNWTPSNGQQNIPSYNNLPPSPYQQPSSQAYTNLPPNPYQQPFGQANNNGPFGNNFPFGPNNPFGTNFPFQGGHGGPGGPGGRGPFGMRPPPPPFGGPFGPPPFGPPPFGRGPPPFGHFGRGPPPPAFGPMFGPGFPMGLFQQQQGQSGNFTPMTPNFQGLNAQIYDQLRNQTGNLPFGPSANNGNYGQLSPNRGEPRPWNSVNWTTAAPVYTIPSAN